MLDFFSSVIEFFTEIAQIISGICGSAIRFFEITFDSVHVPISLAGLLPSAIGVMVSSITAVAVVKAIFGR